MQDHTFTRDESAVSPVVGIVLMIAITMLLAATVGAFVTGFGDTASSKDSPQTAWGVDYNPEDGDDDELTIEHLSGDEVSAAHLSISVTGAECTSGSNSDANGNFHLVDDYGVPASQTYSAGMTLKVAGSGGSNGPHCASGNLDLSSATMKIVWESDGDYSTTMHTWEKGA